MFSKKPLINPILVCPLIALLCCFIMIIFIFQLSQLLFINHYHGLVFRKPFYQIFMPLDRVYNNNQYWTRRRTAFGQRTHRTDQQNQLELEKVGILKKFWGLQFLFAQSMIFLQISCMPFDRDAAPVV